VRRNNSQQNQAQRRARAPQRVLLVRKWQGDVSAPAASGGASTADQLNVPTQMIDSGGSSSTQVAGAMELGPERRGSRLPNTGGEPWLMVLAGSALTLAAWTLRRRVA
jgi:LPXTG-motif cell wall-anchored protein